VNVTVLGSGTSSGVPVVGKHTPVNHSSDPRDKRLRSSIRVETSGGGESIIVDTGPDFRMQALNNRIDTVTNVLLTHPHYDHIGGLDDLRPLCFKQPDGITCYSDEFTHDQIIERFTYFHDDETYYGKPKIHFKLLPRDEQGIFSGFSIGQTHVQPIKLLHIHEKPMYSVGYVFNHKLAYLTDFREIPGEYMSFLYNLEAVIVGAPLPKPHPNHLSIYEAVDLIKELKARQGFITHLSDEKFHTELEDELPPNIRPAFDGMTLKI